MVTTVDGKSLKTDSPTKLLQDNLHMYMLLTYQKVYQMRFARFFTSSTR